MGFIRTFSGFVLALALTCFAVMNRQNTQVFFSPLHDSVSLPLYLVALAPLGAGFVLGGVLVWINMNPLRRLKHAQRKAIKALETELTTLKNDQAAQSCAPPTPSPDFFPALPFLKVKS